MDHVAIMKKSWGLIAKILSGEKSIESRWFKVKSPPWGKITTGDTVYFKNSGEDVTVKAEVDKVLCFADLKPSRVKSLLARYAKRDGISNQDIPTYYQLFKDKRYCLLIFLKNVSTVKPFHINKQGFGIRSSWITLPDITPIILK